MVLRPRIDRYEHQSPHGEAAVSEGEPQLRATPPSCLSLFPGFLSLARLLSKLCPPRLASSHPPRRGGAFVPFVRLSSRALAAATSDGSSSSHSPKVPSSCAVAPVPAHRISAARGASSAAQMSSRFSGTTLIFVD